MAMLFERELEIFSKALEYGSDEGRAAYLKEACAGDVELFKRLEGLIRAHDQAGGFLPRTESSETVTMERGKERVTETVGDRIGRYKLREKLGEGGCGVVYVADQEEPVRRRVALKIIKLGMDTKSVIARFEAERQALAMMDHPNIAKVLDAGATETGRPFFVMELVRGIRITDYCDQHKLSTGARLDLFIKVCQAVQHAHQKGIIHRDLKPSNILVTLHDGVPVPKIIDFGIAKATEGRLTQNTVYTELHQFIGTPAYMSPEQAEMSGLDIDTRSDIYSLGVLLYELLTGGTPFDGKELLKSGLDAMRKTIREMEPPRPSTRLSAMQGELLTTAAMRRGAEAPRLVSAIRGDLDWIVMKCLEKDRTRRYETANGLASDLKRHLGSEPVIARPPTTAYRIQKAIRRNKLLFGATAVVVFALGLGVVASTWQAVRATRAERAVRLLAESENRQRVEAEEQRALAVTGKQEAEKQRALAAGGQLEAEKQRGLAAAGEQEAQKQRALAAAGQEEAEKQRTLATAAAASERDAAEEARQARDSAIQAKLQAMLGLADNYTSRGLEDDISRLNGRAALWFATAAITARDDPDRVHVNLLRVSNWLRGSWTPVAAVGQPDSGSDNLIFDPENSRYLLTMKRNGTDAPPQIWDLVTEQPVIRPANLGPLSDAAWSLDGRVLMGTSTGQVVLASLPELKFLQQWDAPGAVRRVAASPDGRFVAAASGKKLLVWAVSGTAEPAVVEHAESIVYIGFSPTSEQLVTATDDDARARLFGVDWSGAGPPGLRQVLGPVAHQYRGVRGAATDFFARPPVFVQRGRQLVTIHDLGTTSVQGALKWYDAGSGAELATTRVAGLTDPRALTVSPDGNILSLATGNSVNFDTRTRQASRITGNVLAQAFSPNGRYFAFSGIDLEVRKIDGSKIGSRAFPVLTKAGQAAFSNDGKYMAVESEGLVQVLGVPSGPSEIVQRLPNGRTSWAAFSADGRYVAPIGSTKGSKVRTIQISEVSTGKPAGKALALNADLVSADFSPDGTLIAAITGIHGQQMQLRIFNWQTGALASDAVQFDSEPAWLSFAPDGKAVAVHFMNGEATLIDPANGNKLIHVTCAVTRMGVGTYPWASGRGSIGFSHDGKTVFTWGSRVAQAWDRVTGRERWAVHHQQDCWSLAESPDGRLVATGCVDGYLRIWDAADGKEAQPPIEHPSQVIRVAFSPDGKRVATSCLDWQTRVWEVSTGKLVCAMSSENYLTDIRFTPDGRFVLIADAAGVKLCDAGTGLAVSPMSATATGAGPQLEISPDGHWATVAGDADFYCVVDLQKLTQAVKGSPEDALPWIELLSNAKISGSTIANLTGSEWLERWRKYRSDHPEFREFLGDK